MQRLSSTWKQQKQVRTRGENQIFVKSTMSARSVASKPHHANGKPTKRLGQHVVQVAASGSRLPVSSSHQPANREEGKVSDPPSLDGMLRRSPRLKKEQGGNTKIQGSMPLATSQPPLTNRDQDHHGSSFSSSFCGDLDEDVLQAMEEAEANYCHQNQHKETSRNTGTPLQAVAAGTTHSKRGKEMATTEGSGFHPHLEPNQTETISSAVVVHQEYQNSEELFTDIQPKPDKVRKCVNPAFNNSIKKSNDLQSIYQPSSSNSSKVKTSSFHLQPAPKQTPGDFKTPSRSNSSSNSKSAISSAILSELTVNTDKKNMNNSEPGASSLPSKVGQKFMDSFTKSEKENSPAGQVYCIDSQSQSQSLDDGQSEQTEEKQRADRKNKSMSGEQNQTTAKKRCATSPGKTRKQVSSKTRNQNSGIIPGKPVEAAEQQALQQDAEASCHATPSPPTSTNTQTQPTADPLLLSSWGLPEQVLAQYHHCGIRRMFPWQAQCLALGKVLDGGNLVYSAPTSAGKTLVAELLILKRVLETKKKALLILPFVSVAREKMFYLQSMFQEAGVRVGGYMGSESPAGGFQKIDIAVCTIEKANSLVNRLLEENKVDQLGIIVVDELHMVGDTHRGYLLELLLTKVRYVTKKTQEAVKATQTDNSENVVAEGLQNSIQIVGMSATLPNLDHLAKWLDADLYRIDFRPVPLTQSLKVGRGIYDSSLVKLRDFDPPHAIPGDEDQILSLCLETLAIGCSVLIFCPTKNWCEKLSENMAREIARLIGMMSNSSKDDVAPINLIKQSLQDVIEQLKRTPVGLDAVLKRTIPFGVAYHHAGLSFDERDIIEGAFRQNAIKILVATSTLSSGVNLPARRVIIRSVMFNRRVLDPLVYRQMSGRAGRKGVDTEGESILICKPSERDKAAKLMQAALPPVESCLKKPGQDLSNSMKRAILEVIASRAASTPEDVARYASCTLLAVSMTSGPADDNSAIPEDKNGTTTAIEKCVKFLQEQEFVILQKMDTGDESKEVFHPTQLGSATLASALSPDEALVVFSELQRARKNFVLENDLHLLYQVTPIYDQGFQPDWYEFMHTWENLSTDQRRVAELVGIEERFLIRAARGALSTHTARLQHALAIHKRFYTTLILHDLVRETPVLDVARKYGCARGQLQSLQQSAATFAGMVTAFCSKLGWINMELLLAQYQSRLTFGVQRELCDLVRISLLNAFRARLLYNSGLASVAAVAAAKPSNIETLLRKAVPFQSSRKAIGEEQYEVDERQQSRCIWATGRKGLTEHQAALMIVQEAQALLKADLGALGVEWKPRDASEGEERPQASRSRDEPTKADESQRKLRTSPSNIRPPSTSCNPSNRCPAVMDSNFNSTDESTVENFTGQQNIVVLRGESANQVQGHSEILHPSSQPPKTNRDKSSNLTALSESNVKVDGKLASNSQQRVRTSATGAFANPCDIEQLTTDSASTVGHPTISSSATHLGKVDSKGSYVSKQSLGHQSTEVQIRTRQPSKPTPLPTLNATKASDGKSPKREMSAPNKKSVSSLSTNESASCAKSQTESTHTAGTAGTYVTTAPGEGVSNVRTKAKSTTVTVKADVHVDASLLGNAIVARCSPSENLETSAEIVSKIHKTSIQSSDTKSKMNKSNCKSTIPIISQTANHLLVSDDQITANQEKASTSHGAVQDQTKSLTTPLAARRKNPPTVQETSPELFSLPESPISETQAACTNLGADTPVKNGQLSPKVLPQNSPAFSPLDSQMLQFLEQQECALFSEKSTAAGQNVLPLGKQIPPSDEQVPEKLSPDAVTKRSQNLESQVSPAFSPVGPEVLRLVDGCLEVEPKNKQQVSPSRERAEMVVSSPQIQQSSPSYSPLNSQALLFNNSTTSELQLSQGDESHAVVTAEELQFTPSFPTLDSQVLKLVDGLHATRNELAAESASPTLKSCNKLQTSRMCTNKRGSLRSTRRKNALTGKSHSHKKQKLVLTFCQAESPYSEFFQDEEMTLDLAETLECSFVVDQSEPVVDCATQNVAASVTKKSSLKNQPGETSVDCLNQVSSRKKSGFALTGQGSVITSSGSAEPPVYSQIEADLALAAEWSDSFSFDEDQHKVIESPPKSRHNQNTQLEPSNLPGKSKAVSEGVKNKPIHSNCQNKTNTVPVVHNSTEINISKMETPPEILRSTTKVSKSAKSFQKKHPSKMMSKSGTGSVRDSAEQHFAEQLSPGTLEMLDLFAGDSFSRTSSPTAKTEPVPYTASTRSSHNAGNSKQGKSVSNSKSDAVCPTSATSFERQPLNQVVAEGSSNVVQMSNFEHGKKPTQTKGQRKRRSTEDVANLPHEGVPTKKLCQELLQEQNSPPVKDGGNSETPDTRRKSDGDCISPTPPKENPNTPKLIKGTPKQRHLAATETDTPQSLRLRQRPTAQHKEPHGSHQVVKSLGNKKNTPSQRTRKSPRTKLGGSLSHLTPPLNTPQLESPVQSQVDLNAAQGESQLHLQLDSDSSFEVEPPTPLRGVSTPGKHPRISPSHSSSNDALPGVTMQHPSPRFLSTQSAFTIIDVCSSKELFQTFLKEWSSKSRYSLSVACERYQPPVESGGIGGNIRKAVLRPKKPDVVDGFQVGEETLIVTGLSICWEDKDAYFISFQKEISDVDPNDSLAQPPLDPMIPVQQRLQAVKANLEMEMTRDSIRDVPFSKLAFDCKEHYKVLSRGCGISIAGALADPKVAHWLIDPGAKERNLHGLVTHYIPQEGKILEGISGGAGLGSLGLMPQDPGTGRVRAATESVLVLGLMNHLEPLLKEEGLYKAFTEVEMPCMRVLAHMELNGFGFSQAECESQRAVMQAKLTSLEEQAYQMAGHGFSLTSPEDIAQVLYVELKLPPNGDPTLAPTSATLRKTLGARGGRPRLPKHFSTCKDSLERLRPFHPLPGVMLEWRRITAAVTKVVVPLLKERQVDPRLGGERIYASCQTHTATGRVCLFDPNIQAIPRDFEIEMPCAIGESPPLGASMATGLSYPTRARARQAQGRGQQVRGARMATEGCEPGPSCAVSVRHAFCPFQGGVLLAADYSQLELRILAHLSGDTKLAGILNGGGDVFKCIAAQWKQIEESQVTPKQRQQAKQICYGMVYGIGARALGQQLGESDEDAAAFMDSFKMQYKGMKDYIRDTVEQCRAKGYVETILHRKRFLPAITHANPAARSQAERQAVNTTIQGSAADLVKMAMVSIDHRLAEEFPNTRHAHRHKQDTDTGSTQRRRNRRCTAITPSGAFLVLQLHDELIYEVHREDVIQVAQVVKGEMESAMRLSIRLPVKVKVGPTWGSLQEFDI